MENNTPFQPQTPPPYRDQPTAPAPQQNQPNGYGVGGFGPTQEQPQPVQPVTPFASAPAYAQPPQPIQPVQPSPFAQPVQSPLQAQPFVQAPQVPPISQVPQTPSVPTQTPNIAQSAPRVNRAPSTAPWWLWIIVIILGAAVIGLAAAVFLIK